MLAFLLTSCTKYAYVSEHRIGCKFPKQKYRPTRSFRPFSQW